MAEWYIRTSYVIDPEPPLRTWVDDKQIVTVKQYSTEPTGKGAWGYARSHGPWLRIGDVVICPSGPGSSDSTWKAIVVALGSRWQGEFKNIVMRAGHDSRYETDRFTDADVPSVR